MNSDGTSHRNNPLVDVVNEHGRVIAIRQSLLREAPRPRPRNYWAEALVGIALALALSSAVFGPRIMAPAFLVAAWGVWFLYVRIWR